MTRKKLITTAQNTNVLKLVNKIHTVSHHLCTIPMNLHQKSRNRCCSKTFLCTLKRRAWHCYLKAEHLRSLIDSLGNILIKGSAKHSAQIMQSRSKLWNDIILKISIPEYKVLIEMCGETSQPSLLGLQQSNYLQPVNEATPSVARICSSMIAFVQRFYDTTLG